MDANQFCRDETTAPAHVAHRLARGRDGGGAAAFAGDIRTNRAPFGHSRVRERAANRVLAARCTDLVLLARIGEACDTSA